MFIPAKFKGKKALVIGAGKSGVACAGLLASGGFKVLVTDNKPMARLKDRLAGLAKEVEVEAGGHTDRILACGFAVKSPGLSRSNPLIIKLKKARIPLFSEIETAMAFSGTQELLAVTGTNGKTTTTILLGEIMKRALRARRGRARVCGNVGTPAALAIAGTAPRDAVIMETSSYQLEDSTFLHPVAACVLNITPDHIDHHGTMPAYVKAKARIFRFQGASDACVFNAEDKYCRRLAARCPSKALFFSSSRTGGRLNAWIGRKKGSVKIVLNYNGLTTTLTPPDLPGLHNLENSMCAALMALTRGVKTSDIQKTFVAFKGVEHRIETAGTVRGIRFINDSKATNVDSTLVALKSLGGGRRNIWLILGGLDKGNPYSPLIPHLKEHVKAVLSIGKAATKIGKELKGACDIIRARTIANALARSLAAGKPGDIVLLSPACASFDQFRDFEDRGRKFKALVKKLRST